MLLCEDKSTEGHPSLFQYFFLCVCVGLFLFMAVYVSILFLIFMSLFFCFLLFKKYMYIKMCMCTSLKITSLKAFSERKRKWHHYARKLIISNGSRCATEALHCIEQSGVRCSRGCLCTWPCARAHSSTMLNCLPQLG